LKPVEERRHRQRARLDPALDLAVALAQHIVDVAVGKVA